MGSIWEFLESVGLFRDEKRDNIVTLPAASITASSEPVGPQQRCFKGPPSMLELNGGVGVGSLRAQVPSREEQRRFRSSIVAPPGAMDAMLPHLDQAIALRRVSYGARYGESYLTGNTHYHGAHQCVDTALQWVGARELIKRLHLQRGRRYPHRCQPRFRHRYPWSVEGQFAIRALPDVS